MGQYLKRCLDSILAQNFEDYEVIVVDDGSTDTSAKVYLAFEKNDARFKHIKTPNSGSGSSRNTGLQAATGKYIYFCDPDDWIESDLLADNYTLAEENDADVVFFGTNYYVENKGEYILSKRKSVIVDNKKFRDKFLELYLSNQLPMVWNKLYNREYLLAHDCTFSTHSRGQDQPFNIKVYTNLEKVAYNSKCYYNYVKYSANTATTKYIYDQADINKLLMQLYTDMFTVWQMHNAISEEILFRFSLSSTCFALRNIFHFDSPDSHKVKVQKCKQILTDQNLQNKLQVKAHKYTLSRSRKIYLFLIKHKVSLGIELESVLRLFIKRHLVGIIH
jgi:glycosyltransferase involved in cell wall biosynthesis